MAAAMPSIKLFTTIALAALSLAQVVPDATHKYLKPIKGQSRSPCPALNTLANHGYLPREGKSITQEMLVDGLHSAFNVDPKFVEKLAKQAFGGLFPVPALIRPKTLDLETLAKNGVIVHNASLTRPDMGPNYSPEVVPSMVEALLADSPNDWIYPRTILKTRERREAESKRARGDRSVGNTGLSVQAQTLAYGEAALLLLALNGTGRDIPKNDPNMRQWPVVPKKAMRTWLLEERLPDGFVAAPLLITEEITGLLSKLILAWREQDMEKENSKAAPRIRVYGQGS